MPNKLLRNRVQLHLWDTAGQERFRALTMHHYRGAHGAIVVYDITNRKSYQEVTRWIEEVRNNSEEDCVIFLIGNKCDLDIKSASYSLLSAGLNSTNHSRNPNFSLQNNSLQSNLSMSLTMRNSERLKRATTPENEDYDEVVIKVPPRSRQVSYMEARIFAEEQKIHYFQTSAFWNRTRKPRTDKTMGIEVIMEKLIEQISKVELSYLKTTEAFYKEGYPGGMGNRRESTRIKLQVTSVSLLEEVKQEKGSSCCT